MHRILTLSLLVSGIPVTAYAGQTILPAGSLIQCMVSEPKLSSKTDKIGDPVLCQVSHAEVYGRGTVPYGTYLVGRFEDYKDPGHFVGKGWVELKFDRMVIGETNIPLDARVVAVPNTKYPVDVDGKIHGTGHAIRDTITWFIPVLWPIDLINLPRRGPRVVLKSETRLTLKVMDDVGIPTLDDPGRQPLVARNQESLRNQEPAPIERNYSYAPAPQQYAPQQQYPQQAYAAPQQNFGPVYTQPQSFSQPYTPAPQTVIVNNYPPQQQPVVVQAPRPVVRYVYPPPPYAYAPAYPPARYYPGY